LPGIFDNSAPLNSRILFSQENNDSSHLAGWLAAYEAMHAILSTDLLTLSASEVLEYNTEGNRGVVVLPQAFFFSGVRSILFSLWRINSISTSQFMSKFYWELKYKRQTNVQALQEAKIASLKDTFTFEGKKISRAHPYFWATFQLVGNPKIRPPSPTKLPPWAVVLIVYLCVISVALYITRRTMPGRR
jgi:CHAT domain-containing protein